MSPSDGPDEQSAATPRGSPVGSHVLSIPPAYLWRAAEVVGNVLTPDQIRALKIDSGEHLALLLTTAFLQAVPVNMDVAGDPDLVFDLTRRAPRAIPAAMLGMTEHHHADFEVKSLPGDFRKFNADLDKAIRHGRPPRRTGFGARVRSINDILADEGHLMITTARTQLDRKVRDGHSKNVFLIAHALEHPAVEPLTEFILAHLLEPLRDLGDIATVWLLWAPTHLVIWSATTQTWTNLLFTASDTPIEPDLDSDSDQDLLQQIEDDFLARIGHSTGSPYLFTISAAAHEPPADGQAFR